MILFDAMIGIQNPGKIIEEINHTFYMPCAKEAWLRTDH